MRINDSNSCARSLLASGSSPTVALVCFLGALVISAPVCRSDPLLFLRNSRRVASQHSTSLPAAGLHLWLDPVKCRVDNADNKGGSLCRHLRFCNFTVWMATTRAWRENCSHCLRTHGRFYVLLRINTDGTFHYKAIAVFSLPAESTFVKMTLCVFVC